MAAAEGFVRRDGEWESLVVSRNGSAPLDMDDGPSLLSGAIETTPAEFQVLRIGDMEFSVIPR